MDEGDDSYDDLEKVDGETRLASTAFELNDPCSAKADLEDAGLVYYDYDFGSRSLYISCMQRF